MENLQNWEKRANSEHNLKIMTILRTASLGSTLLVLIKEECNWCKSKIDINPCHTRVSRFSEYISHLDLQNI